MELRFTDKNPTSPAPHGGHAAPYGALVEQTPPPPDIPNFEGARSDGVAGLFSGSLKGLTGAVFKPISKMGQASCVGVSRILL